MKKFVMVLVGVFQVLVDYSITLDEIDAAWKEAWDGGQDFTSKIFLSSRAGRTPVGLILVEFDGNIGSKAVLREFDESGLRAATALELLAFGQKFPESIGNFNVVALGSTLGDGTQNGFGYLRLCEGDHPFLCHGDSLRPYKVRYLAVPK